MARGLAGLGTSDPQARSHPLHPLAPSRARPSQHSLALQPHPRRHQHPSPLRPSLSPAQPVPGAKAGARSPPISRLFHHQAFGQRRQVGHPSCFPLPSGSSLAAAEPTLLPQCDHRTHSPHHSSPKTAPLPFTQQESHLHEGISLPPPSLGSPPTALLPAAQAAQNHLAFQPHGPGPSDRHGHRLALQEVQ